MLSTELAEPIWIDQPIQLERMVDELSRQAILAVDTESNSLHAYQEQVCLIQFSTQDLDYLVDTLALPDLASLGELFANPLIEKVFHAAEYDLICLKRDFNFSFANLFDTMVASRILGRNAVGLAALLEEEFDITLDKHYQRANWGQRPLPDAMKAYARLDSHYLVPLRNRLKEGLQVTKRWSLAEEDFTRLCTVNGNNSHFANDGYLAFWKIGGLQELNPRQLTVMHELYTYRDEQARLIDRPHFKVLSNQVLLEIAQTCPHFIQELHLLPSISDLQIRRYGKGLLEAVRRGMEAVPIKRPAPHQRLEDQASYRLEMLRTWRKKMGQSGGVDSDVIMPRDILYLIAEADPSSLKELKKVMQDVPWRFENYGVRILKVLGH
jgi:ribonuclease D